MAPHHLKHLDQEAKSLIRDLPHLGFASQGKSMVDEQGQVEGRGSAWAPGHKKPFPLCPGHLREKQRGVCCSLTALMSKLLSSTAHRAHGFDMGRHIQSVSPAVKRDHQKGWENTFCCLQQTPQL